MGEIAIVRAFARFAGQPAAIRLSNRGWRLRTGTGRGHVR